MREVFENSMVAHLWANQSQERARSQNGNLYFRGDTIYSYGSHFPVAIWIKNDRGERAVLFNSDTYSPTTSHHQSMVSRAIPAGVQVWGVSGLRVSSDPVWLMGRVLGEYRDLLDRAKRARVSGNRPYLLERAKALSEQYVLMGRFWDAEVQPLWDEDWEGQLDQIKRAQAAALAERERRERERFEAREREQAETLARWVAGADVFPPHTREIRLRVRGDLLETSWGAEVPLGDAVRVFRVAAVCRAHKRACSDFRSSGCSDAAQVGQFRVDHIDEFGTIRAGCHLIGWAEAERVARSIGLGV